MFFTPIVLGQWLFATTAPALKRVVVWDWYAPEGTGTKKAEYFWPSSVSQTTIFHCLYQKYGLSDLHYTILQDQTVLYESSFQV